MYMNYNSNKEHQAQATVAEDVKTREVRSLIYILTGKKLSSDEIVSLARSEQPELSYPQGKLIFRPSSKGKDGRYWLWDIVFAPTSYLAV